MKEPMARQTLHKRMGSAVLELLRASHYLPSRGIVAGGAVHAALEALYAQGGAPINDIDVFHRHAEAPPAEASESRVNKTVGFSDPELVLFDRAGYSHCCRMGSRYRYGIKSTTRSGLLNEVYTDITREGSVEQLLAGFDMNYARCGIDLAVGELVWRPEFDDFWHGRQLRIVRATTPFHSLLRYTRKLQELPDCYGNLEQAQLIAASCWWSLTKDVSDEGILKSARAMHGNERDGLAAMQPWFGKKFRDLWNSQQALHGGAFELVENPHQKDKLWCLRPRENAPSHHSLHCDLIGLQVSNGAYAAVIPQYIYRHMERKSPSLVALWDKLAELKTSGLELRHDASIDRFLAQTVTDAMYFSKADHPKHLEEVVRFVDEHSLLHDALAGLSLSEQYRRVELVRRLESRFGLWVPGELEISQNCDELLRNGNELALTAHVEARHAHLCRRLLPDCARLPLPAELNGYTVRELTRGDELLAEGERLHHCVGGYGDALEQGRSRIISLRRGESATDWWTAEVCDAAGGRRVELGAPLSIRQLVGLQNVAAPSSLYKALQECLDALLPPVTVGRILDELQRAAWTA